MKRWKSIRLVNVNLQVPVTSGKNSIRRHLHILRDIDMDVRAGSCSAILGESGAGKTLLMKSLCGLLPPGAGMAVSGALEITGTDDEIQTIDLAQVDNFHGRNGFAMVFQDPKQALDPIQKVGAFLQEVIGQHPSALDWLDDRDPVADLLDTMRMPDIRRVRDSFPHELSGGMLQRVAIAAVLASDPRVVVADEALTALDIHTGREVLGLFASLSKQRNIALLCVSHDLNALAQIADDMHLMYAGRMVEQRSATDFFSGPAHPYGRAILDSHPSLAARGDALPSIPGDIVSAGAKGVGCPFAPRCPHVTSECKAKFPPIRSVPGGGTVHCFAPMANGARKSAGKHLSMKQRDARGLPFSKPILRVAGLEKAYSSGGFAGMASHQTDVLCGVDMELYESEILALVGASGSGKSTLARCIAGLEIPDRGSMHCQEMQLAPARFNRVLFRRMREVVQYVPQATRQNLVPHMNIRSLLVSILLRRGFNQQHAEERGMELLQMCGLEPSHMNRLPGELSGGQRQRVLIARALAMEPRVLILDEPVASLDVSIQARMINTLLDIRDRQQLSMIFITHDLDIALYIGDRMAIISDGTIVESAEVDQLVSNPRHPYTRELLSAQASRT